MKRTHRQRGDGDWPQGDAFAEDAFNRDDDDNNDDGVRAPIPQTRQRLIGNPLEVDDGVQDAYARALTAWPDTGVPARPGAWLTTVARHRALDRLRRSGVEQKKYEEMALVSTREAAEPEEISDLAAFAGVHAFPARIKCATLGWHAVLNALRDDPAPTTTESHND